MKVEMSKLAIEYDFLIAKGDREGADRIAARIKRIKRLRMRRPPPSHSLKGCHICGCILIGVCRCGSGGGLSNEDLRRKRRKGR